MAGIYVCEVEMYTLARRADVVIILYPAQPQPQIRSSSVIGATFFCVVAGQWIGDGWRLS